jgi:hypothetical protein
MPDAFAAPPPTEPTRAKPAFCGDRLGTSRCDLYREHYGPHKDSHTHATWENDHA